MPYSGRSALHGVNLNLNKYRQKWIFSKNQALSVLRSSTNVTQKKSEKSNSIIRTKIMNLQIE